MTSLLIVESPAKCSKIQGFLGPGWRVIATMGHIRALEEDLDAVGLDRDFEPRYAFIKDKGKAIAALKAAAKDASTVFLASDDDREGEAISFSVAVLLDLNPATTPRAVFHEITAAAVKAAVSAPRRIDMNRVHAQQARAVLDMMVGFTISPLLWKFVGPGLSAGRCQTPALRLVADREREIDGFQVETSWVVKGVWGQAAGGLSANANPFEAALTDPLEDEESATNYMENIHAEPTATVAEAVTKPWTESAPKPLITSTLQQEASALYGSQPKNTMRIAQRLYEAGHITYMRTDHAVLSEEARVTAEAYVRVTYGEAFVGVTVVAPAEEPAKKTKKKTTKEKEKETGGAQEAHEAIRPTHVETTDLPTDEDWSAVDRKLYKLIWNRTIQSVMASCRGEERRVLFRPDGDPNELDWQATWRRTMFQGWRRVGQAIADLDEQEAPDAATPTGSWSIGQTLEPGVKLVWRSLEAIPKETKAPPRYTEATLVRELERRGIGRPSTFAALVGTIIDKGYIEKRDTPARDVYLRQLRLERPGQWPPTITQVTKKVGAERQKVAPTALGLSAMDFCMREFPTLFNYDFTKAMEDRLDHIATGTEQWKAICRDTWGAYKDHYAELKATKGTNGTNSARQRVFAGGIKGVSSKKGPLLMREGATKEDTVFFGWPAGIAFGDLTEEQAAAHIATIQAERDASVLGEHEGKPLTKHKGPFGSYVTWNGISVPYVAGDTVETLVAKAAAKSQAVLHTLGPFEFRKGPYGVYFFKKDVVGKARKFASLPTGLDPKVLTVEAATKIYQTGLQQKAKARAFGGAKDKKK